MGRRGQNSTPISLFSFQDIITSVTGIMILVTLMMTLELVQRTMTSPAVQTAVVTSEVETRTQQMRQRIEELKGELERRRLASEVLQGIDPRNLAERLQEVERTAARVEQDVERIRTTAEQAERNHERAKQTQTETERKRQQQKTLEEQLAAAADELEQLKKTNRRIYNLDQGTAKKPWLIDVSARELRTAQVGVTAAPTVLRGNSPVELIAQLSAWLAARDPATEYLVLLIRPSAAELYVALRGEVERQGFELGFDLLGEGQTVLDPVTGAAP